MPRQAPVQNYAAVFNGGKVGIGTSTPAYALEINNGSNNTPVALFDSTGTNSSIELYNQTAFGRAYYLDDTSAGALLAYDVAAAKPRWTIDSVGDFGINTGNPFQAFNLVGAAPTSTTLTTDNPLTSSATTVDVSSTTGYQTTGTIIIGTEGNDLHGRHFHIVHWRHKRRIGYYCCQPRRVFSCERSCCDFADNRKYSKICYE